METTPKVEFLNMTFDLTIIIGTVVTCLIVFLISVLATRGRNRVPKGLQNLVEMGIDFVRGITRMAYDSKTADKYVVFSYTLFMFILVANQLGIFLMVTMNADQPLPGLGIAEGDHVARVQVAHGGSERHLGNGYRCCSVYPYRRDPVGVEELSRSLPHPVGTDSFN